MDWNEIIDKNVFIKLEDGTVFINSKVLTYEEPFISITDKFGYPVIINVNNIMRCRVEEGI